MSVEILVILLIALALLYISRPKSVIKRRTGRKKHPVAVSRTSAAEIKIKWHEVEEMMKTAKPHAYRAALVEADKLLFAALESRGIHGDFVTKMNRAKKLLTNHNDIWKAHKARNRLVHDVKSELHAAQAKEYIGEYRQALRELGIL